MIIKWFAKLLPYFIVEKALFRTTADRATISFTNGSDYSVNVGDVEAGVWIVKSSRTELIQSRKKLELLIEQIDNRLEGLE